MTKLISTVERMEDLKNILIERYEELDHAKKASEKLAKDRETAEAVKAATALKNGTKKFQETLGSFKNVIDPDKLLKLFMEFENDLTAAGGVLILDVRKRDEFNRNRIDFREKWYVPVYCHVPIENAKPGIIGTKLVNNSLQKVGYEKRHSFRLGKAQKFL